ncbi:hypothetical protein [Protaetiibacter mangrovi]|uniref:Uncharacterized protein n=1 Tax=Protaetiibacter mangrovi TaxID=2970926 RepID=A0ABT1ZCU2_9MICO|nr:hypothetical protein [Protaetiibacter mangrovi]MCS0498496.1 hypothetical protein [Protaetiibacter mangrovi]
MSRSRRVAAVALVATVAVGLTGCSFLGDIVDGQRITTERLGVADALRVLVGQLEQLEQVESASYSFDAADVSTTPGVEVELATLDGDDWREVADTIEQAASADALADYPVAVDLSAGAVSGWFDTQYGADWIGEDVLATARRMGELFPDARVGLSGAAESAAFVSVGVPGSAEELLDRVAGDAAVRDVIAALDPSHIALTLGAPGLELSGAAVATEAADWARQVLSVPLPRSGGELSSGWVQVTASGPPGDTWLGVELVGDSALGEGAAWDALLDLLETPVPQVNGPDGCVPLQVMYAWPGVQGNFPSFTNGCFGLEIISTDPDRPSLVALREALAASGLDLEALGFTLG